MVKTGAAPVPSDFVRNEWIEFDPADEVGFANSLQRACRAIRKNANFYMKLGEIALKAEDADYELSFERFKQAALLVKHDRALDRIKSISARLSVLSRASADAKSYFKRLKSEIDRFLNLQP